MLNISIRVLFLNCARIATWQLLHIPNIFFGKPLFKKSQEYKFKGCPILSLKIILPAILIAWLNKKITFKNSNGDKKKHAKKIQVLIADLKSAGKNTI